MLKLTAEPLGRLLRVDEPIEELGISTYDRLRDVTCPIAAGAPYGRRQEEFKLVGQ